MVKFRYPCFSEIDIFGIPPLFTIRGRATFQSQIGSFLTLICIIIIGIYISYFLNQMINHKSPNLYSTVLYDSTPPEIELKRNNFSFVFGLQTKEYINYIDESIYEVKAFQSKLSYKNNSIYNYENIPLKIIKCNEYKFEIIPENFKKLPLNNLYCIDNDINLKGEYMKEEWNYIRLNFIKCENSTENKCKSEEEINELLIGGYIRIFIPDYNFDPTNYLKPYIPYVKNLYGTFSFKYFEDIFLYFKLVEVITDSGYFFENTKSINFVSYDYIQNDINLEELNHFLSLTIKVSTKRETYKRSYIKLQTICSNVGGMLKIILLIGEYSLYFIRITLYKNYILEFFNLDESEIRLKKIRKIYNLPGNNVIKLNIENIFPNLNNKDNSPFANEIHKNLSNTISNNFKNFGFKVIEEKSENINKKFESENKNLINHNNESFIHKEIKSNIIQNNYLLNGGFFRQKSKSKDIPLTNSFLSKGKNSVVSYAININNNNQYDIFKHNSFVSGKSISVLDKNKSILSNKSGITLNHGKNTISLPKIQLRVIKIPGFFSDFVCKKNTFKTIKQVHENYKEIQFLLDIVHYLKSQNELNIIEKHLFSSEQRKALSYTYTFEADFELEREGYDYMIKHKKNKFDEKNEGDTSQNYLLSGKTQKLKNI
jgi:hypothetical protein